MATSLIVFVRDFMLNPEDAAQRWTAPILVWELAPGTQKVITQVQFPGGAEAGTESVVLEVKKQSKSTLVAKMPEIRVGSGGGNDLVLPDASVAPSHAWFQEQDGAWAVVDGGQEGGTFVDGQRISPQTPTVVGHGARIRFGAIELDFLLPSRLPEYVQQKLAALGSKSGSGTAA